MDLLDFQHAELYFEHPESPEVLALLAVASSDYGTVRAAAALSAAERLAPDSLTVLVAVFRYHYYQHNLEVARQAGLRAAELVARSLRFEATFAPTQRELSQAFQHQPGAARFYLQALKGIGYLCLRLGRIDDAASLLHRVVEFDSADRLGCRVLLELLEHERQRRPHVHSVL
jgi:protein-disulfide isomerase-like protein with CxxC motif